MLQRVMIDGIELPRLYIAENKMDAELAMSKGIPFVRWTKGQEALIKILLRPVLEKMFPHINWIKVLGRKPKYRTQVNVYETEEEKTQVELHELSDDESKRPFIHEEDELAEPTKEEDTSDEFVDMDEDGTLVEVSDITTGERLFLGGGEEMVVCHNLDIEDYVGDMSSYVNIEMLQRLRLMPAFIGNILECVKLNIGSGLYWQEGYNKRLGIPVGRFNTSGQLPNLIILDVSGSIPRGISATMISLIDTLRTQLSADLIITSSNSRFYPMGSELPDPQRIRDMFGYGNEAKEFFAILDKHVRGRHYGHVFSFGDNDTPEYFAAFDDPNMPSLAGTTVGHVHHYHTGRYADGEKQLKTGYAKWCHMLSSSKPLEEYDTKWCKVLYDR